MQNDWPLVVSKVRLEGNTGMYMCDLRKWYIVRMLLYQKGISYKDR